MAGSRCGAIATHAIALVFYFVAFLLVCSSLSTSKGGMVTTYLDTDPAVTVNYGLLWYTVYVDGERDSVDDLEDASDDLADTGKVSLGQLCISLILCLIIFGLQIAAIVFPLKHVPAVSAGLAVLAMLFDGLAWGLYIDTFSAEADDEKSIIWRTHNCWWYDYGVITGIVAVAIFFPIGILFSILGAIPLSLSMSLVHEENGGNHSDDDHHTPGSLKKAESQHLVPPLPAAPPPNPPMYPPTVVYSVPIGAPVPVVHPVVAQLQEQAQLG